MRTRALILLFPFSVFLTETASFIPAMKDACTIVTPKKTIETPKKSSCCMKKKASDECPGKKESEKKASGNKCTDNPDCTTCPVCYTFILQQQYEWKATAFLFEKDYCLLAANYIYSYTPNVWKPPNGFLYHS